MEITEIIKEKLSVFKNLYDSIRIVDSINKKVVSFGADNTEIIEGHCFEFWKAGGSCKNCVSKRASLENDTFIKIESSEGKNFIVLSSPVTIEKKMYIVEMIKDISETGSLMNNEKNTNNIENLINEMNEAAVMKK